jgi:hypothetical protein
MSENVEQVAPLRITVSEIKSLLAQGKSRKEIAEYYGRTQTEMKKAVWSNPKLKNLKAKKQYTGIELIEDEVEESQAMEIQAVETQDLNEIAAPLESANSGTWE